MQIGTKSQCIYAYRFPFLLKIVIFAAEADKPAIGLQIGPAFTTRF